MLYLATYDRERSEKSRACTFELSLSLSIVSLASDKHVPSFSRFEDDAEPAPGRSRVRTEGGARTSAPAPRLRRAGARPPCRACDPTTVSICVSFFVSRYVSSTRFGRSTVQKTHKGPCGFPEHSPSCSPETPSRPFSNTNGILKIDPLDAVSCKRSRRFSKGSSAGSASAAHCWAPPPNFT